MLERTPAFRRGVGPHQFFELPSIPQGLCWLTRDYRQLKVGCEGYAIHADAPWCDQMLRSGATSCGGECGLGDGLGVRADDRPHDRGMDRLAIVGRVRG